MKELICKSCGSVIADNEGVCINDECICLECAETNTTICRCCGERVWNEDIYEDGICENCIDEHYTHCTDCGKLIHTDEALYTENDEYAHNNPYCSECISNHEEVIHEYDYKPNPIFYGEGRRCYGVELEIDEGGECEEYAETFLNIANRYDSTLYIKHDGSLDEGMELVSHPATLDYHMNKMCWKSVLKQAVSLGYRSHQAETCGLHIHINRNGLGTTPEQIENSIARIVFFF